MNELEEVRLLYTDIEKRERRLTFARNILQQATEYELPLTSTEQKALVGLAQLLIYNNYPQEDCSMISEMDLRL